ncbi:hypothetical protein T190_17515 [Sinorhizobium meliloti CCBAU 01290]|nr:hypothetical protein T190_17515 [Sinorhizobium meliloti CCBAU 01290]
MKALERNGNHLQSKAGIVARYRQMTLDRRSDAAGPVEIVRSGFSTLLASFRFSSICAAKSFGLSGPCDILRATMRAQ